MGLDIYLKSRAMKAADDAYNAAWEDWKEGDPTPESETLPEDIPGKSALHPDSINEPGYLRSSYNSSGFNSAVPLFLKDPDTTYYGIFAPIIGDDPEPYSVHVTDVALVRQVQERARDVARRLWALDAPLTTIRMDRPLTKPFDNEIAAIVWAEQRLAEAAARKNDWAYSCKEGYVDPSGTGPVYAAVMVKGVFGTPDVHLVVKAVNKDGTPWTVHYAKSADVLAEEFCEQMIRLIERDGECWMTWSG